jgi:MFS family permease
MTEPSELTEISPAPPQERSITHYVVVLVIALLMADTGAYAATLFAPLLPHMAQFYTPTELPWVVTITLLVQTALLPLMGKLSDVFGRRRLLLAIAVIFVIGSAIGALTTSFAWLMVARILQGPAPAMSGVIYAFFREYFPRRMVPIAVGSFSTTAGVSIIFGTLISGGLLAAFGTYHAVFWFLGIYMIVVGSLFYYVVPDRAPETVAHRWQRVDVRGAGLLTIGTFLMLLGVSQGSDSGWTSTGSIVPLCIGFLLLIGFVVAEYRTREPMIDMRLITGSALRMVLPIGFFASVAGFTWFYAIPQMLETPAAVGAGYGFGLSVTMVGVVTLPFGVLGIISGPFGGWLSRRNSPRLVILLCCMSGALGFLLLAAGHSQLWEYVVVAGFAGISNGFLFAAAVNLVIDAVPDRQTGVNAGLMVATASFASSIMPVIVTAILSANVLLASRSGVVYTSAGWSYVFLLTVGLSLVALILAFFMRHGRTAATGGEATL